MGRKLEPEIDNPVDNIFLFFVQNTEETYKKYNWTPNQLTTVALLLGILSAFFLYINRFEKALHFSGGNKNL